MKPLKTRKVAAQSLRKGTDFSVTAKPLKKSFRLATRPRALSASLPPRSFMRSRRKMAGSTPRPMVSSAMTMARPAAPDTWSGSPASLRKKVPLFMIHRNQGETT